MTILRMIPVDLEAQPGPEHEVFCDQVLALMQECNDRGAPFDGETARNALSTMERYVTLQEVEIALLFLHEQKKIRVAWIGIGGEVSGTIVANRT